MAPSTTASAAHLNGHDDDDDHPLWHELSTLKADAARYQHEAHSSSMKLQRHVFETSQVHDQNQVLERQNSRLTEELNALRALQTSPRPASLQVAELTVALRRLSEKQTLTEDTLSQRTDALATALSERATLQHEVDIAHSRVRESVAREQEWNAQLRQLETQARCAVEERNMADFVVQEYADLVRTLSEKHKRTNSESDSSAPSSESNQSTVHIDPSEHLAEGRIGLQRLLQDFNSKVEALEKEVACLHSDLTDAEMQRDAYKKTADEERQRMVSATMELETYRRDDSTAAKMVSRYMRFSQSATDALQTTIETQKARHTATQATQASQIEALQLQLLVERNYTSRLREALDDLTEDISRETYGRRREVSLRLALIAREERIAESLRRWTGRAAEFLQRIDGALVPDGLQRVLNDAEDVLETLDGEVLGDHSKKVLGRIISAEHAVVSLNRELQDETDKCLALERRVVELQSMVKQVSQASTLSNPLSSVNTVEGLGVITAVPGALDGGGQGTNSPSDKGPGNQFREQIGSVNEAKPSVHPPQVQNQEKSQAEASSTPDDSEISTEPSTDHPLLAGLRQIKHRYDDLQRTFRGCHLALSELKREINGITPLSIDSTTIHHPVVQTAIGRLDDFSEDARVELEIRIIDEERIARGYETLLSIPNALSEEADESQTLANIRSFVDGSDDTVRRALQQFSKKCTDLEHDIAAIKHYIHSGLSEEELFLTNKPSPGWPSLTNLLSPPSRPASPNPAPTFGSVMTSPRLRHLPSQTHLNHSTSDSPLERPDPFAALGLRIAMPAVGYTPPPRARLLTLSKPPARRPRTSSTVYFLGFGSETSLLSEDSLGFHSGAVEDAVGSQDSSILRSTADVE